jgi:hypothetical protein
MSHQYTLNVQSSPDITLRIVTSVELTSDDGRVLTKATAADIAKAIPPGSLAIGFNPMNLLKKSESRPTTTLAATRATANTRTVTPNPRSPPPPVQHWQFYISPDLEGRCSAKWKVSISGSTRSVRVIHSTEIGHAVVSNLGLLFGVLILKRGFMATPGTSEIARNTEIQRRNAHMSELLDRARRTADQVPEEVRMEKFLEFTLLELARAEEIGLPWKNVGSGQFADWVADPAPLLDEMKLLRKHVEEKGDAMRSAWNIW